MAMFIELRPGESVEIGDTRITIESKSGARSRLKIDSPGDVRVQRSDDAQREQTVASPLPQTERQQNKKPAFDVPSLAI